jgi:hypothetical protein
MARDVQLVAGAGEAKSGITRIWDCESMITIKNRFSDIDTHVYIWDVNGQSNRQS